MFSCIVVVGADHLMKGLLNSVFETCENSDWVKSYPPYDIGTYSYIGTSVKMSKEGS